MKKRRHQGKYEFSAYDTSAGHFSARKIPKKLHWYTNTNFTLDDLLTEDGVFSLQQNAIFEPSG